MSTHPEQPSPQPPSSRGRRSILIRWISAIAGTFVALGVCAALVVAYALTVMAPNLPSLDALTNYQPKVPLRIYTADHVLIGEFGDELRRPVRLQDIPDVMKKAVLAIEDARFYEHGGVDFLGIWRAGLADLRSGGASQGASTITMQVARKFYLSDEKTYTRKIYEMLLAYKIERTLSKDQILQLYMNQIYLGEHAYGFAAAARVYFDKDLKDITLAQAAMLAGLPKAPSAYNPIVNPKRAKIRQEYILKRMLALGYITQTQYDEAIREDVHAHLVGKQYSVHAEYVAETVRQIMYERYKDDAYARGFSVTTTVDSSDQAAAYGSVRKGVMDYDQRHGYRGPEGFVELPSDKDDRDEAIDDALANHPDNGEIVAAVVTSSSATQVQAQFVGGKTATVTGDGLRFAAIALSPRASQAQRIHPGSIVRLVADAKGNWRITQLPQVEGTLVSLSPQDGAIRAMVGGFDFNKNRFNHATQAWRQPGSSFKPFVYSAALERGFAPGSIINDAPLYFPPAAAGAKPWEPKDDDPPQGPMTMRHALENSINLASIRILGTIGVGYAREYVTQRFGFDPDRIPPYLPMVLGVGEVTPLQMATAYSVFANGGYRVNPYLISEVDDEQGKVLWKEQPLVAGKTAPQAITARNSYVMTSLLQSVAQHGTGAGSNVLHRTDLAGKTGTTNNAFDGWFAGFQHTLVAVAWLGYDQPRSLGSREFGAQLALPIWVGYMQRALQNVPEYVPPMPEDVVSINGELYFDDLVPGHGFVTDVGLGGNPFAAANGTEAGTAEAASAPSVAPVDSSERQQIIDLFKQ
ncbi:penicillin-binding protein 1A [Paraburkholderia mimosarum]|uniref:penicillin-binding protein 1A n=1 Tax=Paraburkholderia mimosarum TaxID=312026 RepID=UPI0005A8676E|nr:penicillin-binding protein 1A [Paraburkholderia mimosarum]